MIKTGLVLKVETAFSLSSLDYNIGDSATHADSVNMIMKGDNLYSLSTLAQTYSTSNFKCQVTGDLPSEFYEVAMTFDADG